MFCLVKLCNSTQLSHFTAHVSAPHINVWTRLLHLSVRVCHQTRYYSIPESFPISISGAEKDRMYSDLIADKPAPRPPSPKTPQAKDPRHKLPDRTPSFEIPVDRPAASERSATSEQSGFWTPNSGSGLSSDCGYATSSLPYPESVGGYSATPSESNFVSQSDVVYTPSTPQTTQVGFIDNMLQMAPPPVAGYNASVPAETLMFNADSFRHPPPQFEATPQSFESPRAAQNFDRSYNKTPRSGYEHYDRSFQQKDCGRDRRDNRWEWNDRRDRSRSGGKDAGSYHSHHKGAHGGRKHNRDKHRNKEWNNGRNRDWENNGREWEDGRQWDSGGGRREWESEGNSQDNNWSKEGSEQQYVQQIQPQMTPQTQMTPQPQMTPQTQMTPQQLPPPQIPTPLPAPVSVLPPVCMPTAPPPMSTPLLPPMPDVTTAPPPLPQAVVALQTSPDIDSRRSTSLEDRIQSLLRQNSEFDDTGSDSNKPDDDDAPPLPPTTEEVAPPPLPPEPEESAPPLPEESAPPLPSDDEAVCDNDIPSNGMLSTGEMLQTFHTWATSDFVHEESVEVGADRTPVTASDAVTEETADIVDVVSDDDDRMSLSSLSSGEEKLEVTAPPPPGVIHQQLPGGVFTSPTLLPTWDKLYMQNMYNMQATMLSPSYLNVRTVDHEYEESRMFSGVLDRVIAELRAIMTKDLSKKMVETSAFKSFEGWWDGEKNTHKVRGFAKLQKFRKSKIKLDRAHIINFFWKPITEMDRTLKS